MSRAFNIPFLQQKNLKIFDLGFFEIRSSMCCCRYRSIVGVYIHLPARVSNWEILKQELTIFFNKFRLVRHFTLHFYYFRSGASGVLRWMGL